MEVDDANVRTVGAALEHYDGPGGRGLALDEPRRGGIDVAESAREGAALLHSGAAPIDHHDDGCEAARAYASFAERDADGRYVVGVHRGIGGPRRRHRLELQASVVQNSASVRKVRAGMGQPSPAATATTTAASASGYVSSASRIRPFRWRHFGCFKTDDSEIALSPVSFAS